MAVTVGVPRETFPGERRVAITPRHCDALAKLGASVIVERSAGVQAGFPDDQYAAHGARLASRAEVFQAADVIVQVRTLGANPEAGPTHAAKAVVLGAGVARLQAIATARRLGAVVRAYDVRQAVKEQVESLGAKFVGLSLAAGTSEDNGGYAKAMDEQFYRRQRELLTEVLREQDVVITTAAVPGKKAPVLITAEMTGAMAPGSVIVDIVAERGGNCELTRVGETIVHQGVTILGPLNLPSMVPYHASQMFASNVTAFLKLMVRDGALNLNLDHEISRETLVTHANQLFQPRVRESLGVNS